MTSSEEYLRLSEESTRKLTQMADMVLQMETERDEIRAQFDKFKTEVLVVFSDHYRVVACSIVMVDSTARRIALIL